MGLKLCFVGSFRSLDLQMARSPPPKKKITQLTPNIVFFYLPSCYKMFKKKVAASSPKPKNHQKKQTSPRNVSVDRNGSGFFCREMEVPHFSLDPASRNQVRRPAPVFHQVTRGWPGHNGKKWWSIPSLKLTYGWWLKSCISWYGK